MTDEQIAKLYDQALIIENNGDYVAGELDPVKFAKLVAQHERLMCSKFLQETINPLKPEYIEQIKEGIWND